MGGSRLGIDEKVSIVLAGRKGEEPTANLCRRHRISERALYRWRTQFLEGGKEALRGSTLYVLVAQASTASGLPFDSRTSSSMVGMTMSWQKISQLLDLKSLTLDTIDDPLWF